MFWFNVGVDVKTAREKNWLELLLQTISLLITPLELSISHVGLSEVKTVFTLIKSSFSINDDETIINHRSSRGVWGW